MADHDIERLLAAFADHLLKNRLADEKHGRYMVNWVRRFLAFPPPMTGSTVEEVLKAYLQQLEEERYESWQVEQARQSVRVWLAWRQNTASAPLATPQKMALASDQTLDPAEALDMLSQTLRVRHYSYRTEQTYLDWTRRYFDYLVSAGWLAHGRPVVTEETFQLFIAHLATRLHVGSNTLHKTKRSPQCSSCSGMCWARRSASLKIQRVRNGVCAFQRFSPLKRSVRYSQRWKALRS